MNYFKQLTIVTLWEYRRFFKPKNELLGIVIMIMVSFLFYFGGKYALTESEEKQTLLVMENTDSTLVSNLAAHFVVNTIKPTEKQDFLNRIQIKKDGLLLESVDDGFMLYSYKKTKTEKKIRHVLDQFVQLRTMNNLGLNHTVLQKVLQKAEVSEKYFYSENSKGRTIMAYFFAVLMLLAVFLSFAYQFVAITGEKQLKITEQIVSAIKPQVWMDGKILGITLTGLSSMLTYTVIGILGGLLYFQFTGAPVAQILEFIHLPSIVLFICFSLAGILIWNSLLAAVAATITDPNNSGKSSLMLLPILFVVSSFLVMRNPDSQFSVFLSWFPLTSSTAMPMRQAVTEVSFLEIAGALLLLFATFYFFRILAAKIFRVSILISGKEPGFNEIVKLFNQKQ